VTDPLIAAARFLTAQLDWLRHATDEQGGPYAASVFAEIRDCASRMRAVVEGPADRRYLGPCGAVRTDGWAEEDGTDITVTLEERTCYGDVYARDGAPAGRCRTCGAEVDTGERRAWLDAEVRSHTFRAIHIAQAYRISVDTIRSWATRPRPDTGQPPLASYWRTDRGLITPWVDPVLDPALKGDELKARLGEISDEIKTRGGRLHYVGDVLDLAAADAARREQARAERARRAAARETAEMGA
jgi:hypothetical protein